MRLPGSVLIVVLGLLAILAIVGVTFVMMTNLDRSTAVNFAIQTQFMLAADGAVDYVCHHMVQDLWEYDVITNTWRAPTPFLLTGSNVSNPFLSTEAFDWPGWTPTTGGDPWLATTVETTNDPPQSFWFSYGISTGSYYGPAFRWGAVAITDETDRANNLGIPNANGEVDPYKPANGVWIPEISFPFETGLIRVSITVQDHGGMINLNAHGNTAGGGELAAAIGRGFFVSDVDPSGGGMGVDVMRLLQGDGVRPGLWGADGKFGNPNLMEAALENPTKYSDLPFTLDEEFELRRMNGTLFTSRIERFAASFLAQPGDKGNMAAKKRLNTTTVGWTSQVRGDGKGDGHQGTALLPTGVGSWSARKPDVNLDDPFTIFKALYDGRAVQPGEEESFRQFCVNIAGFRTGKPGVGMKQYRADGLSQAKVCASRQPIFSKISASSVSGDEGRVVWTVKVEVFNPWPGNIAGETVGLSTTSMKVNFEGADNQPSPNTLTDPMPNRACQVFTAMATCDSTQPNLSQKLRSITLTYPAPAGENISPPPGPMTVTIDEISSSDLGKLQVASGMAMHRPILIEEEQRDPGDTTYKTTVLYIGDFKDGMGGGSMGTYQPGTPAVKIPIRFPRSVDVDNVPIGGLPPRAVSSLGGTPRFRAIPRLGDLDQVLCPPATDAASFWPWVPKVARAAAAADDLRFKFNWDDIPPTGPTAFSRAWAANLLTVGGPWLDRMDNDGDQAIDDNSLAPNVPDKGVVEGSTDAGRFAGPEMRVAGKINLNTATQETLQAVERGLNITGLWNAVQSFRNPPGKPILTPADKGLLSSIRANPIPNDNPPTPAEDRDRAYTRLSNIVGVRSDTFSIYGTVQYIDALAWIRATTLPQRKAAVKRTRRFWALVDRSPSLAYTPTSPDFIHPRVLNFQWLD